MIVRVALAATFVAAVSLAAGRRAPDLLDRPLQLATAVSLKAVPIPATGGASGTLIRSRSLIARDPATLATSDEIRLKIGTYGTSPLMNAGTLTFGSCVFIAVAQRVEENYALSFRRQDACAGSSPAVLTLTFAADTPVAARAALWTTPDTASAPLVLDDAGVSVAAVGRRIVNRSDARVSRAALLAFMWELPVWAVWGLLLCGGLLVALGGALADRAPGLAGAGSAFAISAGVALCYAIVVPPLQGPDEPDHLLSFATLAQRPALATDAAAWARRIHFDRVTFHADERFTPADRDQPFARAWPEAEVFAENVTRRSSTTTRFWQAARATAPARPPHVLLYFRVLGALVFGFTIGVAAALIGSAGWTKTPALLAPLLALLPTLPFFGMQMSELTFTLTAFVLIGCAGILLQQAAASWMSGPLLGVALALIAAGPRSGWPTLAVPVMLCGARLLLAGRDGRSGDLARFWGGVALPGALLFGTRILWIPAPFYEQWQLQSFDPRTGISSAQFVMALVAGSLAGAALEWLLRRAPMISAAAVARAICALGVLAVVGCLGWSAWGSLPTLPTVESVPAASVSAYVQSVLAAWATPARIRAFDFLTWTSLWAGFGWVSAILPDRVVAIVTIAVSLAAAASLFMLATAKDGRGAIVALCGVMGITASVVTAAISSYGLHRNVHGRYLLGGTVIGMVLLVAPSVLAGAQRVRPAIRSAALLALACAVHAYSLSFLLEKYFG